MMTTARIGRVTESIKRSPSNGCEPASATRYSKSIEERTARICEEANELHQAEARDKVKARAVAHAIVDRVFDKASGAVEQEVGGVIVTTLAYCAAKGMRLDVLAGKEIARVMQDDPKKFRDKQAAKADLGIAMRPE